MKADWGVGTFRTVTFEFPSPFGVSGMKDGYSISAALMERRLVSVPFRGKWNERHLFRRLTAQRLQPPNTHVRNPKRNPWPLIALSLNSTMQGPYGPRPTHFATTLCGFQGSD